MLYGTILHGMYVSFEMVNLAKKGGLNWLYKTFSKG